MNGQTVAILESRLGEQLAELVVARGGKALRAPALAEIADVDPRYIAELIREWQTRPVKAAIFQTGVGTHALFKTTDVLGLTDTLLALLESATVVVRGPKPTAALRSRAVRIDLSANDPFTTAEVLDELNSLALRNERVVVQRYGATNPELEHALRTKGATIVEIPTYRWSLPEDTRPLAELIAALARREVDSVVFTSASQVQNLFELAHTLDASKNLAANLNATLIASIGPVCTTALEHFGIKPKLEARPPKLGPLLNALDAALSQK